MTRFNLALCRVNAISAPLDLGWQIAPSRSLCLKRQPLVSPGRRFPLHPYAFALAVVTVNGEDSARFWSFEIIVLQASEARYVSHQPWRLGTFAASQ